MTYEYLDLTGRVLFLTQNPDDIKRQLQGESLDHIPTPAELRNDITTDGIIPPRFTSRQVGASGLGLHLLRGLNDVDIYEGEIKNGGFDVLVVGENFGSGSSREHATMAIQQAGIKAVFHQSLGVIFTRNAINSALPTLPFSLPEVQTHLREGKPILTETYLQTLGSISRMIAENGGLLPFTRKRLDGQLVIATPPSTPRLLNPIEKIIARNLGVISVEPGQQVLVSPDRFMFYELQTKDAKFTIDDFQNDYPVRNPERFVAFEDHLALRPGEATEAMRQIQREICTGAKIRFYPADAPGGNEGICHSIMAESYLVPGQTEAGNDSHTNAGGASANFTIAIGATEMAMAFFTSDVLLTVPEVIKINLEGKFHPGVRAKDLILTIGAMPEFSQQLIGINRTIFFSGPGIYGLSFDERFVLANMTRELQAEGGLFLPDQVLVDWLKKMRPTSRWDLDDYKWMNPDEDASYSHQFDVNLAEIQPTIALPGNPQKAVPLTKLRIQKEIAHLVGPSGKVKIDEVYAGSCMGGTLEVLGQMAEIVRGHQVASGVIFRFQACSQQVLREARRLGYVQALEDAGAILLQPGCGACMNAGPGSTDDPNKVYLFNTNRNYPGRTGKATAPFLSSERVAAASAVLGYIGTPEEIN